MSDVKYTTETTQKVFDNDFGFAVVIGEDSDGLSMVSIYYSEDGNKPTSDEIRIDPNMALLVAKAIEKQAMYIKEREHV